jgi:cell division protein FtsN
MQRKTSITLSLALALAFTLSGCGNEHKESKQTEVKVEKKVAVQQKAEPKKVEAQKETSTQQKVEPKKETSVQTQTQKTTSGNPSRGQKLFAKRVKKECGVNGGEVAKKHTQSEWEKLLKDGKLADELSNICNGVKVKEKYLLDIGAFLMQFASDSGNVPSC